MLCCLIACATTVEAQEPADSVAWRQQATAKIEQGVSLYREGRYLEAAEAFDWVAQVDMWYMHAGARQIMALVRAGLADSESTDALTAAVRAFRVLDGFPLPDDLRAEYEAIDQILEERANPPQQAQVQSEPPPVTTVEPAGAALEPTVNAVATETPPAIQLAPTPTPVPVPPPLQPAESVPEDALQEHEVRDEPPPQRPAESVAEDTSQEHEVRDESPPPQQPAESVTEDASQEHEVQDESPPPQPAESVPEDALQEQGERDEPSPPQQPAESVTEDTSQEHEVQDEPPPPVTIPADQDQNHVAPGDIVSLGEVTIPPQLIESEPPVYPRKARLQRLSGDVRVLVLVGVDGTVERLEFVSVPRENFGFEEAVEEAIKRWRFEPASKDGVVVRTWVPIRIPCRGHVLP